MKSQLQTGSFAENNPRKNEGDARRELRALCAEIDRTGDKPTSPLPLERWLTMWIDGYTRRP